MTTLIVNYQSNSDKKKFQNENKDTLGEYKLIYVNAKDVAGVRVDVMPEFNA